MKRAHAQLDGPPSRPDSVAGRVGRRELLGIPVAQIDYEGAVAVMEAMIARRERGYVCAAPVHAIMVAKRDPELRAALRGATLTVPDGMPLVWAANLLGERLTDRVYGPELMSRFCDRSADCGHRVWLYGGRDQGALAQLALCLRRNHPGIEIVGGYSPPFRALSRAEEDELAEQINAARPDVLWVGIGVPKQEKWMASMRDRLEVPVMCGVGAAFDFHAGRVAGTALDAGPRARVDLPDRAGAAPAAAALPAPQPDVRGRDRPPARRRAPPYPRVDSPG
jgi:N-acetylglucosaminyldiphosphoundecaprenol N-acetyl-beta-D-mannosaminyltransferase